MLIVFQKELSNHGLVEVMLLLRLLDSRAPTNQYNLSAQRLAPDAAIKQISIVEAVNLVPEPHISI
jgi:hypothetical protein